MLIALKSLRYDGRSVLVGESFEATRNDAALLTIIKFARPMAVDEPPPKIRTKRRRKSKT